MIKELMRILRSLRPSRVAVVLRYFTPLLGGHRSKLVLSFLLSLLSVGFVIVQPWPIKFLVDYILIPSDHYRGLLPLYSWIGENKQAGVVLISILIVLVAVGKGTTDYYQTVLTKYVGQSIVIEMRIRLFEHIQKLSLAFHSRSRSGDVLMRLTGDINLLRDLATGILITLISDLCVVIAVIVLMVSIDLKMTLMVFSVIPFILGVSLVTGLMIREATHRQRRKESEVSVTAHEALMGMPIIQAYSREEASQKVLRKQSSRSFKEGLRVARLEALASQWTEIILAVGTVIVILVGVQGILATPPTSTPGELLLYYFYLRILSRPIRNFSRLASRAAKALVSSERVMEILQIEPDIQDTPDAVKAPALKGGIEFRDVTFAYGPLPVLHHIDLAIAPGEKVAIVGPSGAGKSTLLSLLPRFYDPTEGRVLVDGEDIQRYTLKSIRGQIGIVLQDTMLFGASVMENITFGKPDADFDQVTRAARRAQAHSFIRSLPERYDTVLAERGVSLSQGQRQRLALARCLLRKSSILLLDEPTSNVDAVSERLIIKSIRKLGPETTCLIVTHNTKLIDFVDRVVFLEDGRIVETGSPKELMAQGGFYARLRRLQESVEPAHPATAGGAT